MKRGLRIAIAAFVLLDVLLVLILSGGVILNRRNERHRRDELAQWVGDNASLSDQQREELYAQATGAALEKLTLRSECSVQNGSAALQISNGADSACTATLELVELSGGRTLAQTERVDPGYCMENVALDEALAPGEYQCLARFSFYWMENGAYVGSAARQVLLRVE